MIKNVIKKTKDIKNLLITTSGRPAEKMPDKNDIHIISIIYFGTLIAICCLTMTLILGLAVFNNHHVADRVLVFLGVLLYLSVVFIFIKKQLSFIASWLLILLFGAIATYILISWRINAPIGILTLGFVIFLSAVLFGSRYIIRVTICCVFILLAIQTLYSLQIIVPDRSSLALESSFGDVISYGTIFGIFALIGLITGRQKEEYMHKVNAAELELAKEKDLLEIRLDERTRSLKEAQIKEINHLLRFAELGQLTTVILHELANNLSVLNLDIDSLKDRHENSSAIKRAQESIKYLDLIVDRVRQQLKQNRKNIRFNAMATLRETLDTIAPKLERANIKLENHKSRGLRSFYILGDPLRLSQTLTIIINNAVDAYTRSNVNVIPKIVIHTLTKDGKLVISVQDYGPGVPRKVRANLFKPLTSSKDNGLGIGLFIAKQIIETHFSGTLNLGPSKKGAEFIITLPGIMKSN
jgi:signal transduction histidine kinase